MAPNRYFFCPACGTRYAEDQAKVFTKFCAHCQFTVYANQCLTASALIIENGQMLLVKRARDPFLGTWDTPGGFVDIHEHPEQAVVREVKEELGVDGEVVKLVGLFAPTEYIYQEHTNYNCDVFYEMKLLTREFQPQDDVADFAWFPVDQLPIDQVGFTSVQNVLKKVEEMYGHSK